MALSNDLMVSNGLSIRGRVGFDRSGSADMFSQCLVPVLDSAQRTDNIAADISMLEVAQIRERRLLGHIGHYN